MRRDQTCWQCSRCGHREIVELGQRPSTDWWALTIARLRESFDASEKDVHLCATCSTAIDKWLRDEGARIVDKHGRVVGEEVVDDSEPPAPMEACPGSGGFLGRHCNVDTAQCQTCHQWVGVTDDCHLDAHARPPVVVTAEVSAP